MATWIRGKYPGVYYREHAERKHGRYPDRYWTIRHTVDGRQIQESLGWGSKGWTEAEANRILSQLAHNKKHGDGPATFAGMRTENEAARKRSESQVIRDGTTVDDLAKKYLAWARTTKKTWSDDETRLRLHILPVLGELRLQDVTRAHVDQLRMVTEAKDLAPATVVQVLALTRAMFNYAQDAPTSEKDLSPLFTGANPARLSRSGRGVRLPELKNARLRVLTRAESQRLLEGACLVSPQLHDLCLVALDTGLRLGEAVRLRPEHLQDAGAALRVMDSKGRNRTVYPDASRAALVRRATAGPYLFPGRGVPHVRTDSVVRPFGKAADLAWLNDGIEDTRLRVTYHTLRHTYATHLYIRTRDLHLVQKLLGHQSISTTERYVHLADELMRHAALGQRAERG